MMRSVCALLFSLGLLVLGSGSCGAQQLPDSLIQQIYAGTTAISFSGDSVEVPLVGTPTLPLVEARINGAGPYRFLVDLGANVTLLRRNVVDASGSTVLVERSRSDIVRVGSMQLGGARLEQVTVGAYDSLDVDGVLGFNVLQHVSFTLDFPGKRLVLHRRSLPSPDGVSVLRYEMSHRLPFVVALVGRDTLRVNLDTGASEWMTIPPREQARLRWATAPAPGRTVSNNQTGKTQILEGRLADPLRLGGLEIPSVLVYVNSDAEESWLGASAMNRAVWTFDPKNQRVQVSLPGR